jgi:hypothetical protein
VEKWRRESEMVESVLFVDFLTLLLSTTSFRESKAEAMILRTLSLFVQIIITWRTLGLLGLMI